jgi:hypothetical protein
LAERRISLIVLQFYCPREEYKRKQKWLGRINKGRIKEKGF